MAIVKMSKFRLTFFNFERDKLLGALQNFRDVHFNDLSKDQELLSTGAEIDDIGIERSEEYEKLFRLKNAIEVLSTYEKKPENIKEKFDSVLPVMNYEEGHKKLEEVEIEDLLKSIETRVQSIKKNNEQSKILENYAKEYSHWEKINIPLGEIEKLKSVRVRFGTVPRRWMESLLKSVVERAENTYIEIISNDGKQSYVMIIDDMTDEDLEEVLRDSGFIQVSLNTKLSIPGQINEINKEINSLKKLNEIENAELDKISKKHLLHLKLKYEFINRSLSCSEAKVKAVHTEFIRFIEGYVPTERGTEFKELLEKTLKDTYEFEIGEAEKFDADVPIELRNNKLIEPFDGIVKTYSLPRYYEKDPTPQLMPWFMIFFGLMLGDFGYGLIMFIGTTLMLKLFNLKKSLAMNIKFFQILSIPTMISGLIFGSFFGGLIQIPGLFDPTKNYMLMLIISVVIGVVNILCGLALGAAKAVRNGDPMAALYDFGFWYMILIGLGLYGLASPLSLSATVEKAGAVIAIVGAIGVVLFSARENKGFGRYTWGLYNLYGVTSYIGDIVSYTRIAALMLSGAYIGYSGNLICGMLVKGGPAGIVGGVFVVIFFHLFNMFLSGLSGYVHSMRLIYVEFFGKYYEGGGVPFIGLEPEATYIELK